MKRVIEQFIEWRGRGVTLSGRELLILADWEKQNVSEDEILLAMHILAEEYQALGKPFPSTLFPIQTFVKKRLQLELKPRRSELSNEIENGGEIYDSN